MNRVIPLLLILALTGLIFIQYRYLIIGLRLEKATFDRQMEEALSQIEDDLEDNNRLSYILASVVRPELDNFKVGQDTLLQSTTIFLQDFLADRLNRQGIAVRFSFSFQERQSDSTILQTSDFSDEESKIGLYTIRPQGALMDFCECVPIIQLRINNLTNYLISQLNGITIPSVLLIMVIIACFFWYVHITKRHKQLDQVKNEFINNLTHELKTPVFSIGLATNMLAAQLPPDKKNLTDLILAENNRLKLHIERVLDLATLDHHQYVMNSVPCKVHDLLSSIAHLATHRAQQSGGTFMCQFGATQDLVLGDQEHLTNAIDNLLDNAIKYGGIPPQVLLSTSSTPGSILISVADNGAGIPTQEEKNIFKKFYRIQRGDLHPVKGFGLGLSYVARVAALHKGKISLVNQPGQGCTFTLSIPLIASQS
ncbi:MAG: HAMP domain-containing histidine kinase [Bacteroidia bacterium]|nr:HAMP domain-containing histidine kinase [Bacteroidia bacterium]